MESISPLCGRNHSQRKTTQGNRKADGENDDFKTSGFWQDEQGEKEQCGVGTKKESLRMNSQALQRMATAYSPNWYVSTIGDDAFNFSVRDGKRWVHIAIVTTIYV